MSSVPTPFEIPSTTRFRGIPIEFGDVVLVVPAFNIAELRQNAEALTLLEEKMNNIRVGKGDEIVSYLGTLIQVTLPALARNYPGITLDWLEETVDMNQIMPLYMALSGAAGIVSPGKLQRSGTIPPIPLPSGSSLRTSTGEPSLPTSASPSDGPTTT
jgi:hypothetical protein